ncbi:hypothetical protein BJ684DRAFT_10838 [Piptocephalis cylindrospora]|uniref:RING-type domain-containing protein n=1 Tax=Piptocephalis cylindrospora TaxID=1907219 RepID=A0A4P9Y216_9FUNG|nr:hypothetical protein BJ684DRAFT_10838 [Piptocephalis cylindrospora]|eukprot:RKP12898.1 hypothetical protein BJ684DRAFT_10838 [Piptocephalis cylindrospora]
MASPHTGQWGDYVTDGASLDDIISQIMDQASSSSRSSGVSEERIDRIPWHTIQLDLDTTAQGLLPDCAVCKDDFLPEERVRQLEGCHHQYHDVCIRPWLLQHASCPVW